MVGASNDVELQKLTDGDLSTCDVIDPHSDTDLTWIALAMSKERLNYTHVAIITNDSSVVLDVSSNWYIGIGGDLMVRNGNFTMLRGFKDVIHSSYVFDGEFVIVKNTEQKSMTLCEVEVYGNRKLSFYFRFFYFLSRFSTRRNFPH